MSFMERLQSAMILKTSLYHPHEADLLSRSYQDFYNALKRSDKTQVEAMIYDGFDVDHHLFAHLPPLIYVIEKELISMIQTLLLHGASVNIQTINGDTPLHYAVKLRNKEIITLLLRYGADKELKNAQEISPFELSREIRDRSIRLLLENTQSMLQEHYPIFELTQKGDLAALSDAVSNPQDYYKITEEGQTLLHLAIKSGNLKMITYLINKNIDLDHKDKFGNTAMTLSCIIQDRVDILKLLNDRSHALNHKNLSGSSPLTLALKFAQVKSARYLIEAGAKINTFDDIDTPLTLVHRGIEKFENLRKEYQELETLLLIKGAHVDVFINKLHWTPLMLCISRKQDSSNKDHYQRLIELGADVNHQDLNGRTPVMLAASTGYFTLVQHLINNYADLNIVDNFGWNALMLSVYYKHFSIAQLLLEYNIDVNQKTNKGVTALKIAQEHQLLPMIRLLLDFGAKEEKNSE